MVPKSFDTTERPQYYGVTRACMRIILPTPSTCCGSTKRAGGMEAPWQWTTSGARGAAAYRACSSLTARPAGPSVRDGRLIDDVGACMQHTRAPKGQSATRFGRGPTTWPLPAPARPGGGAKNPVVNTASNLYSTTLCWLLYQLKPSSLQEPRGGEGDGQSPSDKSKNTG